MRKAVSLGMTLALLVVMVGTTGCLGRGALNKSVGKFNLEVSDNKWVRWGVFLLLSPVYGFAGGIDLMILNSIEFHTGTNPWSGEARLAKAGESHLQRGADGEQVVSTLRADGSIDLAITEGDGAETKVNVRVEGEEYVARDATGKVVARTRAPRS